MKQSELFQLFGTELRVQLSNFRLPALISSLGLHSVRTPCRCKVGGGTGEDEYVEGQEDSSMP